MSVLPLHPYQAEAVEAVKRELDAGRTRPLVVAPTGSGKTWILAELVAHFLARGQRALLAVHREELVDQLAERVRLTVPDAWLGIEQAARRADPLSRVVVASVPTLAPRGSRRLDRLGRFDVVFLDECFPAGTPVDGRPIETLRAGDAVRSFHHDTGVIEWRRVTRIFRSRPRAMAVVFLSTGFRIVCTAGHPFFTGSGYIPAALLRPGDTLFGSGEHEADTETLRRLRNRLHAPILELDDGADLLRTMQSGAAGRAHEADRNHMLELWDTRGGPRAERAGAVAAAGTGVLLRGMQGRVDTPGPLATHVRHEPTLCLCAHDGAKSHAEPGSPNPDVGNAARDRSWAADTGRQWPRAGGNGDHARARLALGLAARIRHPNPSTETHKVSDPLQARPRRGAGEDCRRDRRDEPPRIRATATRREKRGLVAVARVDRVEVYESADPRGFEPLCPDGFVYNLDVEGTHNYFVNGLLVHNCHHAPAPSYQALFRRLGCFTPGGPPLIGCTATPRRGDGIGLGHIFQSIAVDIPLPGLIADGYLCPLRGFSVETTTALDYVRRRAGDFDEDELSEAVNTPGRNALAVRAYQAHAPGHQAVVFCVDRRHVHAMHGAFLTSGLAAATLTGDLPHKVRAERLDAFRRGALRVLVNCGVLVEGIDVPPLSAAVLSRPTASPLLFAQMLGRILRTSPGKRDAVAIDLVDNTRAHSLQTLATLAGLPPKIRFQGERLFEIAPRIERVLADKPWLASAVEADRLVTVDDILQASHPVDLLYLELPLPEAFQRSRLAWVAVPPARWVLSAPDGTLAVRQTLLAYEVGWRKRGETETTMGASPTLEEAVALAERVARTYLVPSALRMLDRRASWRQRPASDGQKAKLDRYGIPYTSETTAGEASLALSRRFAGLTTPILARQLGHQTPKEAQDDILNPAS